MDTAPKTPAPEALAPATRAPARHAATPHVPAQPDPVRPDPGQSDPAQPDPARLEPPQPEPVELLVCVKCRRGQDMPDDARRPGAHLFDALACADLPEGVRVTPVECLQNCDSGCSVAMRGGDRRWTYVYGNLHEASHLTTLTEGLILYHQTADGVIPWRARPDHFKKNCIARIPPQSPASEDPTS